MFSLVYSNYEYLPGISIGVLEVATAGLDVPGKRKDMLMYLDK